MENFKFNEAQSHDWELVGKVRLSNSDSGYQIVKNDNSNEAKSAQVQHKKGRFTIEQEKTAKEFSLAAEDYLNIYRL